MNIIRNLFLALVAAIALTVPITVAGAQAEPDPTEGDAGGNVVTFGVQPANATEPDARNYLSFGATKGARISDHVAARNYSLEPLTLKVRATDATNTASGDFALLPETDAPTGVGSWIRIPDEYLTVTVPPRSFTIIPFELVVPGDARSGDHIGGVVVTLESAATSSTGQNFKLLQGVGARIFVRVSGAVRPRLSVQDLAATYEHNVNPVGRGSVDVSYTVENTGNVGLGGRQVVTLSGPFGYKAAAKQVPEIKLLLPGRSVGQRVRFDGVPPLVRLHARVSITPLVIPGSGDKPSGPFGAAVKFWAVPWALIAIVLLVTLLVVRERRRRRQKANDAGNDDDRPGNDPPDGPGPEPDAAVARDVADVPDDRGDRPRPRAVDDPLERLLVASSSSVDAEDDIT